MTDYPVKYLSFSSCRTLCTNPFLWWNKYVRGIWRDIESVPMSVGKAVHKHLELYYLNTHNAKEIEREAMKELFGLHNVDDYSLATKQYQQAIQFWFDEDDQTIKKWGEVIHTESKHQAPLKYGDYTFPLDLLAITDVVTQDTAGNIHLHDYKVVSAVKKPTQKEKDLAGDEVESTWESPEFVLQAMFNFYTCRDKFGQDPETFTFWQIKKTKNRDGSPQVVPYTITYSEKPHYVPVFISYIKDVTLAIEGKDIYLPNFFDMLSGKEAWDEYLLYLSEKA